MSKGKKVATKGGGKRAAICKRTTGIVIESLSPARTHAHGRKHRWAVRRLWAQTPSSEEVAGITVVGVGEALARDGEQVRSGHDNSGIGKTGRPSTSSRPLSSQVPEHPFSGSLSPFKKALSAIFGICKKIAVKVKSNEKKINQLLREFGHEIPSESEDEVYEDPFAAYEATRTIVGEASASSSRPAPIDSDVDAEEEENFTGKGDLQDTCSPPRLSPWDFRIKGNWANILPPDHATALGELRKANTVLQAECARLTTIGHEGHVRRNFTGKGDLQDTCSPPRLSPWDFRIKDHATALGELRKANTVLQAECARLTTIGHEGHVRR
uniref:Uncharacterized protein n=1 Tax=Oryza brachyantha TaxID=4533 RepID=J3L0S7_ORYBR